MKRILAIAGTFAFLAALAPADTPITPSLSSQALHLQRNRELINKVVLKGLQLAKEIDPLARAEICDGMARHLIAEIRLASKKKDAPRAAELADHLRDLLKQGVADNLISARENAPEGSSQEPNFLKVRDKITKLSKTVADLNAELSKTRESEEEADLDRCLAAIHEGRDAVDQAIKSTGKE
jgi:hypothetical protein